MSSPLAVLFVLVFQHPPDGIVDNDLDEVIFHQHTWHQYSEPDSRWKEPSGRTHHNLGIVSNHLPFSRDDLTLKVTNSVSIGSHSWCPKNIYISRWKIGPRTQKTVFIFDAFLSLRDCLVGPLTCRSSCSVVKLYCHSWHPRRRCRCRENPLMSAESPMKRWGVAWILQEIHRNPIRWWMDQFDLQWYQLIEFDFFNDWLINANGKSPKKYLIIIDKEHILVYPGPSISSI